MARRKRQRTVVYADEIEMPMRWWYELYDASPRDYGSDWGYVLYYDRKEVERVHGWSSISRAGDAARAAKAAAVKSGPPQERDRDTRAAL